MSLVRTEEALPRLAKYELLEEIGHGGMATVYRGKDLRLGREVAVKVIHKHLRESKEVATRFVAEARAVAKLRHPNIVEVYDVSDEGDQERFLVVELLRGTTLRSCLADHGQMPPEVGAAIALEVAAALSHAHEHGVVHRDVKPENVLVEGTALARDPGAKPTSARPVVVKLTDFGIAKILDAQGVTSTGQVLGSPAHMAPEQIEGGDVDARADVFGLGVLLYECMVGHLPFEGKNPAQVLRRVLDGTFSPADRERPTVGGRWATILARALAKDASHRYESIDVFAKALRAELEALGVPDPKAEMAAYFVDPEAYVEQAKARLVPTLMRRGEGARKQGDALGAAADFNRALAYAPNDPAVLKLVARVTRGRVRRRALALAAAIGVGSAVLGLAAFGAVRWLRHGPPPPASSTEPAPPRGPDLVVGPDPAVASPIATPNPTERRPATLRIPPVGPPVTAHVLPATRDVAFQARPGGALVKVDSGPFEEWQGLKKTLKVGPHTFTISVPNSPCCEDVTTSIEVKADESGSLQRIPLSVQFRPARLSVANAPPEGRIRCSLLKVDGPASQVFSVKLDEVQAFASCTLEAPGMVTPSTTSITVRAGELRTIAWPQ